MIGLAKNLSKKEQYYVSILIVVIIFFVSYKFVWEPLTHRNNELKADIDNKIQLLSWMKSRESTIRLLRSAPKINNSNKNMSILAAITKTMQENKIDKIKHDVSQIDSTTVNINFPAVSFDEIMKWITELRKNYGIMVKDLTAVRDPKKSGAVKISFSLEKAEV